MKIEADKALNLVRADGVQPDREARLDNDLERENSRISEDFWMEPKVEKEIPRKEESNYIQAFINNKMVSDVIPNIMNHINIWGNVASFAAHTFNFNEGVQKFTRGLGALTTKAFLVATAVINIVERLYTKNFLSALGYFNDILVAGLVEQDNMYLARGTASGTYNMANALSISNDREDFNSFEDHIKHLGQSLKKFFDNFFSGDIVKNFADSSKAMWAIFGGIFANVGALSWIFSGKTQVPTVIRDIAGIVMDIEQLNFGHYKAGRKDFFMSGVALVIGTLADWASKIKPELKNAFVPLTFIFDGIGRHLLRKHQNMHENLDQKREASFALAA